MWQSEVVTAARAALAENVQICDVEARDIRVGDDLFGAGVITRASWVGGSVRVEYGGTGITLYPDEVVTVRRAAESEETT